MFIHFTLQMKFPLNEKRNSTWNPTRQKTKNSIIYRRKFVVGMVESHSSLVLLLSEYLSRCGARTPCFCWFGCASWRSFQRKWSQMWYLYLCSIKSLHQPNFWYLIKKRRWQKTKQREYWLELYTYMKKLPVVGFHS